MPPKAKFTREEVISAALEIVRANGEEALTARSLGEKLGSSARPVFTLFDSMEEIKTLVLSAAKKLYDGYVEEGLKSEIAFKGVGQSYIRFAAEQPKLFKLLFMREQSGKPDKDHILAVLDDNNEKIINSITQGYGVNRENAKALYMHLWVYSHGLAVLIATGVCAFTAEEISEMLTQTFKSLITRIKTEGKL